MSPVPEDFDQLAESGTGVYLASNGNTEGQWPKIVRAVQSLKTFAVGDFTTASGSFSDELTVSGTPVNTNNDHGNLTGLGDDDHPQYGNLSQNETVSGDWNFTGSATISGVPPHTGQHLIVQTLSGIDNGAFGNTGTEDSGVNIDGTLYRSALKVSEIGGGREALFQIHRHSTTLSPIILSTRTNSDDATHTSIVEGQNQLELMGAGWTGSHYDVGAEITYTTDSGTISNSSLPTRIEFRTNDDGQDAVFPQSRFIIRSDGTLDVLGNDFRSVGSLNAVSLDTAAANDWNKAQRPAHQEVSGQWVFLNFNASNQFHTVLSANTTFSGTNIPDSGAFTLITEQDSAGGHTVSFGDNFKFVDSTAPTATTTASGVDVFGITCFSGTALVATANNFGAS